MVFFFASSFEMLAVSHSLPSARNTPFSERETKFFGTDMAFRILSVGISSIIIYIEVQIKTLYNNGSDLSTRWGEKSRAIDKKIRLRRTENNKNKMKENRLRKKGICVIMQAKETA